MSSLNESFIAFGPILLAGIALIGSPIIVGVSLKKLHQPYAWATSIGTYVLLISISIFWAVPGGIRYSIAAYRNVSIIHAGIATLIGVVLTMFVVSGLLSGIPVIIRENKKLRMRQRHTK